MEKFTNRLINETSPYLLQHAHNPVDWYPWGEEAIQKATLENKPILLSIGYAACHWCHVMERESFEDEDTAAIMNNYFVNIKIDREERPDLDHIYMDAVQSITGSGGWPLNVFLTPDTKPFYGGTYFPPEPAFNRPSWKETLLGIRKAFSERNDEIKEQANNLTAHLIKANSFGLQSQPGMDGPNLFSKEISKEIFSNLMKGADKTEGGFGKAPKFPQTFSIQFCLHHFYFYKDKSALEQACQSLDKMICGGIYDQLGGGFARYATDNEWLVPHFEKMLYDNALLLIVLAEAYQATKNELYKTTIDHTIRFIEREWKSPENGFFSALDADSEGVEGKYYVWSKAEIESVLTEGSELFCEYYNVTVKGNWENSNILHKKESLNSFAAKKNIPVDQLEIAFNVAREKLLTYRDLRIRPLLDDKILMSWNALLVTALCKSYSAVGNEHFRELAISTMDFIWTRFQKEGDFYHTYTKGEPKHPAFLDDYAFVIQSLIHLQEITGETKYVIKASHLTQFVIDHFSEEETGFFFYTRANQKDIIVRKKEVYDGATPSGNSIMMLNLYYLAIVFNKPGWSNRALKMVGSLQKAIVKYPTSFGVWATFFQSFCNDIPEIALIGEKFREVHLDFLRIFIPFKIFQSATLSDKQFPLLADKPHSIKPQFYLCKQYSCQKPVFETDELLRLLGNV